MHAPCPGGLSIVRVPPILATRSRMERTPKCPGKGPVGSKPFPLSCTWRKIWFNVQGRIDRQLVAGPQDRHLPCESCHQSFYFQRFGAKFEDERTHLGQPRFGERNHIFDRCHSLLWIALQRFSCGMGPETDAVEGL